MTRSMIAACFAVTFATFGCSGNPAPAPDSAELGDAFDPDGKADGITLAFYKSAGSTTSKLAGVDATVYQISDSLSPYMHKLDSTSTYGCFWGTAAKVSTDDIKRMLGDSSLLGSVMDALVEASDGTDPVTSESLARASTYSSVVAVENFTATDASSDAASFKAALRVVIKSMLSSSSAKVYHLSVSPDWTDDVWVSVDSKTGVIKAIMQGGDC